MKLKKGLQETYINMVGRLDLQIQEIKELVELEVELPLTHPEDYEEMCIKQPKCVILYDPAGSLNHLFGTYIDRSFKQRQNSLGNSLVAIVC